MDLKQLQTFLTLSELKSFTRTADKLGYAQSNITAQIKQLERNWGSGFLTASGIRSL